MLDDIANIQNLADAWGVLPVGIRTLLSQAAKTIVNDVNRMLQPEDLHRFDEALLSTGRTDSGEQFIRCDTDAGRFVSQTAFVYVLAHATSDEFLHLWSSPSDVDTRLDELVEAINGLEHSEILPIILVVLHNEYGRSACELIRDIALDTELFSFWEFLSGFCAALPYLRIAAGDLIPALQSIERRGRGDLAYGEIHNAVENYAQHNQDGGWELYRLLIAAPEETTFFFAANVLIGIARGGGLDAAFTAAIELTRSEIGNLRVIGIGAISGFDYPIQDRLLTASALERMNELRHMHDEAVAEQLTRAYFKFISHGDDLAPKEWTHEA